MAKNSKELDSITQNRPFFIEVPKPVSQMSLGKKDSFIEEILKVITQQYK